MLSTTTLRNFNSINLNLLYKFMEKLKRNKKKLKCCCLYEEYEY
jgi:hypothetical protein